MRASLVALICAAQPGCELVRGAYSVVEYGGVDVPAGPLSAVLGSIGPSVLDREDRLAGLLGQAFREFPHVGEVRLAVGLINEPDVDAPHVPGEAVALKAEVEPVWVAGVGVPAAGVVAEP